MAIAVGTSTKDATPDATNPPIKLEVCSCLVRRGFSCDNLGDGTGAVLVRKRASLTEMSPKGMQRKRVPNDVISNHYQEIFGTVLKQII